MAFRRDVPSLKKLLLRYFGKQFQPSMITDATVERAHQICKPSKNRTHKAKQELLRILLSNGKFDQDSFPMSFFDSSLTRLEIIGSRIADEFVQKLIMRCGKLHTLNLSGSFRMTDAAMEVLVKNCAEIKDLSIDNCRKLSDKTLENLMKYSPKLVAFDVGGNFNMTIGAIHTLIQKHENHARFSKVNISGHPLTDQTLHLIASKCRKLHTLSIGYASVSDDAIIALLEKRKSVSRLRIHWNSLLTDKLLHFISVNCPNLQDLSVCGVKNFSADVLLSTIHQKMSVVEEDKSIVSDGDKEKDKDGPPVNKRLKRLDCKYTSLPKDSITFLKDSYPEIAIIH